MKPQSIGNWLITEKSIKYIGPYKVNCEILKDQIFEPRPNSNMYEWLLQLASKTWLTKEDIYALNTAFIYACEAYNISFPPNMSFVETFNEQLIEMNDK